MGTVPWKQTAGWSGIAFVVVFLVGQIIGGDAPGLEDSAGEVREWFEDNEAAVAWQGWLNALAFALLFLLFTSGLRGVLGPADASNEGMWSRLSFAAAIVTVAIGGATSVFAIALSLEDVRNSASDSTVGTLNALDTVAGQAVIPWGAAVILIGASVVILQSGVMAKWLGWLGLVAALLAVVGSLWPVTGDDESFLALLAFIGLIGFLIWTLAVAISMIRSESSTVS